MESLISGPSFNSPGVASSSSPATPLSAPSLMASPPSLMSSQPQAFAPQPVAPPAPPEMREFGDTTAIRRNIYSNVMEAAAQIQPISNNRHTLRLSAVRYQDPEDFSLAAQKRAILTGQSQGRRLQGLWELVDNATQQVVDTKKSVLMTVPNMTDRGTFVRAGTEYTLKNQQRLSPGVFTRIKSNGEIETHVNVLPGKGATHRYFLDPDRGVFKIKMGQGSVNMMPLLKVMGATSKQIQEAWGPELYGANFNADSAAEYQKLYSKFLSASDLEKPEDEKREALRQKMESMELDANVTRRTLGREHTGLTLDALLDISKKLVAVSRKEQEPDDRDALTYQNFYGPEDLFAEKIRRSGPVLRNLLWKASAKGNLKGMPSSALHKQLESALMTSGLGQAVEEINPAELFDKLTAVSRLGEGGIPSTDSIPMESRSVQPSMFGYIDPLRTPECYAEDMEVMTQEGWKPWPTVTQQDKLACLIDERLEYHHPERLVRYPYNGEMYGAETATIAYLVTPEHRMLVRKGQDTPWWRIEEARETHESHQRLLRCGGHAPVLTETIADLGLPLFESRSNNSKAINPDEIAREDWAEFVGWYLAEGNCICDEKQQRYGIFIAQSQQASPETYSRLAELLDRLPFNVTADATGFTVGRRHLYEWAKPFGLCNDKYLPAVVETWSVSMRQRLLEGLMFGDGRKAVKGSRKGKRTQFCSTSKKLADGVHQLLFSLGISSRVVFESDEREERYHGCWIVHVHSRNVRQLMRACPGAKEPAARKSDFFVQERYQGTAVYCATVPGGLLYVRRHGKGGFWCGNSGKVGVDTYFASNARKGRDGKLYAAFVDTASGETVYKTPQDVAEMTIGFPGSLNKTTSRVAAMRGGKVVYTKKGDISLTLPNAESAFNALSNMIPMKNMVKGQRLVMASRMTTQALPIVDAEAPLVQSALPGSSGGRSFEEQYSSNMGVLRTGKPGVVQAVNPDGIVMRYDDGTTETKELYQNFPFNRKTFIHQTPTVQPGQRVDADAVLAHSNFSDKSGAAALGRNARTAYVSWEGKNFEDAVVVSEAFAKKMTSEHMYQHDLEIGEGMKTGKKNFLSLFPATFDKKALSKLDDSGVIRVGEEVAYGDPLVLAADKQAMAHNKVHKPGQASYADASVTWEHHDPGVVTDVVYGKNGPSVVVKAKSVTKVGDKLSGRYGDKGVIADIIPDHRMPTGQDGQAYEVLLNPLGIITRTNPAQVAELLLGKIAAKRGQPIKVEDFDDSKDMTEWVMQELAKEGLSDLEDIVDPSRERKISGIATGNRFFMKLHHTAEGKGQSRGGGAYTMEDTPAKGGASGSKRIGLLDSNALLSHGATATLQDVSTVRGQKNDAYWLQFMSGHNPTPTKVPQVYKKFVANLQAAGINVVNDGPQTHIMAMTDKDVNQLAGDRVLESSAGVDWDNDLSEIPGGLFDKAKTGGHGGTLWSAIELQEPLPNPVMEDPIRHLLGLTAKQFDGVLSSEHQLGNFGTGPKALQAALKNLNVDKEMTKARLAIAGSRKSDRDSAVRRLGYLKTLKKLDMSPADYMLSRVPVLPPKFRPVAMMSNNMPLVHDANHLYKELMEANSSLGKAREAFGDEGVGAERLATYAAFKAVTGLGDPISPKSQEKNVQGLLRSVFGSSPKFGTVQRKLLSTTVDNVGRAVITPNPDLDMDAAGLPESKAFAAYEKFVARRLVRQGMKLTNALGAIRERNPLARKALLEEMEARPIYISRAPVLHKYGIMAFRPRLTKGETLQVSPLIVKGFNADFDGDAMNYHVPSTDSAVTEAFERLLPSRNLFSLSDFKSVMHAPANEYVGGLFHASEAKSERPTKKFNTLAELRRAYAAGQVNVDDNVQILERDAHD